MSKYIFLWIIVFFSLQSFGQRKIVIKFEHIANGKKIVLNDSIYENDYGEKYTVSKLKYYISNISFFTDREIDKRVHLIDVSKNDTIIKYAQKIIRGISFTIGVDSILNCSGAQEGALDPLNDMFWTWNSGYINFKLEGKSENSTADKKRIEQHIGGYKGEYETRREIIIPIDEKYVEQNNTIIIKMCLDDYWTGIKIAENSVIAAPGVLAKKAADQFGKMFSIKYEN